MISYLLDKINEINESKKSIQDVYVYPHQAHELDDEDLDPLGTGKFHMKRNLKFGQNSMRTGR